MQLKLVLLFVGLGLASAIPQPNRRPYRPGSRPGNRPGGSTSQLGGFSVECGISDNLPDSLLSNFIVGGQFAEEGDVPWQVAVSSSDVPGTFYCGGCYLGAKDGTGYILTAAHCLSRRMWVTLGLHNRIAPGSAITKKVKVIIEHPDYDRIDISSDIAMLKVDLTEDEATAAGAKPVCLPTTQVVSENHALVSGWGTTSSGGAVTDVLKYVSKPLFSKADCEKTGNAGYLDNTMICAGDDEKDACQGDSGGPLVSKRNGKFELVGTVSWGFGCGLPKKPGVYADVFHFNKWIKDLMGISSAAAQYPINLPVQYPALG